MAKKRKVNKSQEIRDYFGKNPSASAKQVVEALGKRKVKVSTAMVANVKSKSGLSKPRKGRKRITRGRPAASNGSAFDILVEAKKFRTRAGSTEAAIAALKTIDRLDSIA